MVLRKQLRCFTTFLQNENDRNSVVLLLQLVGQCQYRSDQMVDLEMTRPGYPLNSRNREQTVTLTGKAAANE